MRYVVDATPCRATSYYCFSDAVCLYALMIRLPLPPPLITPRRYFFRCFIESRMPLFRRWRYCYAAADLPCYDATARLRDAPARATCALPFAADDMPSRHALRARCLFRSWRYARRFADYFSIEDYLAARYTLSRRARCAL